MLTNKKIWVLIIVLSLFFVSCWVDNTEKEVNNSVTGEKNKALWGEALEEGSKNISIFDWIDNEASQKPNFIK